MQKIEFQISINASANKVWQTMWFHQTYKKWTTAFCEGSYYKGVLKEGEKIHFLIPSGSGMYSIIDGFKANEYAAFRHLGEIKNFEEESSENQAWSGAMETYTLKEENGTTTIYAKHDAADEFVDWFNNVFPKAMEILKNLAEQPTAITVETIVEADIDKTWNCFTIAEHIEKWNNASEDWHTPKAINNLTVDGKFDYRMEAKDGSFGFNFTGVYTSIDLHKIIAYTMDDGRKCTVHFIEENNTTKIIETFDAEEQNTYDLQEFGWQAILNNFKKYVETN